MDKGCSRPGPGPRLRSGGNGPAPIASGTICTSTGNQEQKQSTTQRSNVPRRRIRQPQRRPRRRGSIHSPARHTAHMQDLPLPVTHRHHAFETDTSDLIIDVYTLELSSDESLHLHLRVLQPAAERPAAGFLVAAQPRPLRRRRVALCLAVPKPRTHASEPVVR